MVAEMQVSVMRVSVLSVVRCFLCSGEVSVEIQKSERSLCLCSICDRRALPDAGVPVSIQPHTAVMYLFCRISNRRLVVL